MLRTDDGQVRVVLRRPELALLTELAVAQPRRSGAGDPAVLTRIALLLRELVWCTPPDQRHVVTDQLARLRRTIAAQDFDDHDTGRLAGLGHNVEQALHGRWPAHPPTTIAQ